MVLGHLEWLAGLTGADHLGRAHCTQSPTALSARARQWPRPSAELRRARPHPSEWVHRGLTWPKRDIPVRGRTLTLEFQVLGPFVRMCLPERPVFLIVVKGRHRQAGKRKPRWQHCAPGLLFGLGTADRRNLAVALAD